MSLFKNIVMALMFILIPVGAYYGNQYADHTPKEPATLSKQAWIDKVFFPKLAMWDIVVARCKLGWQVDQVVKGGETGVVPMPPVPKAIEDMCYREAMTADPMPPAP